VAPRHVAAQAAISVAEIALIGMMGQLVDWLASADREGDVEAAGRSIGESLDRLESAARLRAASTFSSGHDGGPRTGSIAPRAANLARLPKRSSGRRMESIPGRLITGMGRIGIRPRSLHRPAEFGRF
jgi:hypothetical protein